MQTFKKRLAIVLFLALFSASAIVSCSKPAAKEEQQAGEHPSDSTEHPSDSTEHPTEHPADSTNN